MTLHIVTIVLDGMPFLKWHLNQFRQLPCPWRWYIVEGYAAPVSDTNWCQSLPARLSEDGSHEYIQSIADLRVWRCSRREWAGKTAMINYACEAMMTPGVLMQIDSDELWTATQLEKIMELFKEDKRVDRMDFFCRYHIAPGIQIISRNTCGNNSRYEWRRAWRFTPGRTFVRHEPPLMRGENGWAITQADTEKLGLIFDHCAYMTQEQVEFKAKYYGRPTLLKRWLAMQHHDQFPCKLSGFFPWIKDNAVIDKRPICLPLEFSGTDLKTITNNS